MKVLPYPWLFCFLCEMHSLQAQTEEKNIMGIVKDGQTLRPVPYAHAFTSALGTYTNEQGEFSLPAGLIDTLRISHINYRTHAVAVSDITHDTLFVFLTTKDQQLDEVLIRGLPSEDRFKQQVLGTRIQLSVEEVHAKAQYRYHPQVVFIGIRANHEQRR